MQNNSPIYCAGKFRLADLRASKTQPKCRCTRVQTIGTKNGTKTRCRRYYNYSKQHSMEAGRFSLSLRHAVCKYAGRLQHSEIVPYFPGHVGFVVGVCQSFTGIPSPIGYNKTVVSCVSFSSHVWRRDSLIYGKQGHFQNLPVFVSANTNNVALFQHLTIPFPRDRSRDIFQPCREEISTNSAELMIDDQTRKIWS